MIRPLREHELSIETYEPPVMPAIALTPEPHQELVELKLLVDEFLEALSHAESKDGAGQAAG